MIQGLLSTGGQQAAQQRAVQLKNYANNITKPQSAPTPNQVLTSGETVKPFQEVLQSTAQSQFGSLLTNQPITSVQAQISQQPELRGYAQANKPQILSMISQISKRHGVDEKLVKAVIQQESGFNTKATSHCGAKGLMQLMPSTASFLNVDDSFHPEKNIEGGARYLRYLLNTYKGNLDLALAAYNAGEKAVAKYNYNIPPYRETQNYVKRVYSFYKSYNGQ